MSADTPAPAPRAPSFQAWTIRILALVGVLACLALIGLFVLASGALRPQQQPAKVEAADRSETFTIGQVSPIAGGTLLRMDVMASSGDGGSYSGSRDDRRNVRLFDTATGHSRRVLPDNRRQIARFDLLPDDGGDTDDLLTAADDAISATTRRTVPPRWYLLLAEQNGPGLQDVLVGDLVTGRQAWVLRGVDGVDSVTVPDAGHVALVLREQRKLFYRTIDMTRLAVATSAPIAID